jgi:IclR family transcriptional regulator, pca regulon regulatory protein
VTDPEDAPARSTELVQSLKRGLSVLLAFDAYHPKLTLSDVARETGLTRATARRFLLTLVDLGYVRSDGREFALRPKVMELSYAFLSSMGLPEIALPHMEQLVSRVLESCSISVLDGTDVRYIARVPTQRIMSVSINLGTRFPAYATSMGRVLLAAQTDDWLDEYFREAAPFEQITNRTLTDPGKLRVAIAQAASRGYCVVDQELEVGLRSVAVPLHDASGAVIGAMNTSVHASRSSVDTIRRELLPPLLATALAIDEDLRISHLVL